MKLKVLDIFSGIGGFSLGLERTGGFETVAFCEIDPFCRKVLAKHWPNVRQYEDVRTLTAEQLAADGIIPDVICGGFPCQPFSTASHGRRVATDLSPQLHRLIDECRPEIVIAENVQQSPIERTSTFLASLGYRGIERCISAHDCGGDHQRNRWWVCAYTNDKGKLYRAVHAKMAELPALCSGVWSWSNYADAIRVSDGLPDRVDRNTALGNSVLPQIPELIGHAILEARAA